MNRLMVLRKLLLQLVFSISIIGQINAQSQEQFMPDALSTSQIQVSENLSQGVLNINIPVDNSIIPISLSYSTGGIRLGQKSGSVGLGWNLNVGGSIQRQKRGLDDWGENGYCGENGAGANVNADPDRDDFEAMALAGTMDTHPDIYTFSFLGNSGMFTFDENQNIVKLTQNNFLFVTTLNDDDELSEIIITDESGVKYYFGGDFDFLGFIGEEIDTKVEGTTVEEYRARWHLRTAIDRYDRSIFSIYYQSGFEESTVSSYAWKRQSESSGSIDVSETSEVTHVTRRKRLSSIQFGSFGKSLEESEKYIHFTYSDDNSAEGGEKLDKISVTYWEIGARSYDINLNYAFMGDDDAKRLMLKSIQKGSEPYSHIFKYYGEGRYEPSLPARISSMDGWGFSNSLWSNPYGAKNPSLAYARANTLKGIVSGTAQETEYNYELNDTYDGSQTQTIGGLRIKTVYAIANDDTRQLMSSYDYTDPTTLVSSGKIIDMPIYERKWKQKGSMQDRHQELAYNSLSDMMGRHIAYKYVTVTASDDSYVCSQFMTFEDDVTQLNTHAEDAPLEYYFSERPGAAAGDAEVYDPSRAYDATYAGPFGYKAFHGTAVGTPVVTQNYDSEGNKLTQQIFYYSNYVGTATVKGMNFLKTQYDLEEIVGVDRRKYYWNVNFYEMGMGYLQLSKIEATAYDIADVSKYLKNVIEYRYESIYNKPTYVISYRFGDGENANITKNNYLFNSPGTLPVITQNLLGLISSVEQYTGRISGTSITTNKLLSTVVNTYTEDTAGEIILGSTNNFIGSSNLVSDVSYSYDAGRLIQTNNDLTDMNSAQLWDDEGRRVIASASNADADGFAFTSFEGYDLNSWAITKSDWEGNMVSGFAGEYAYDATSTSLSVTRTLTGNKPYLLSYWYKEGSVSVSVSGANELVKSKTVSGWTYHERIIERTATGSFTLTANAKIDELKILPLESNMSTVTYDPIFGPVAQSNGRGNIDFVVYDAVGRTTAVYDENKDIVSTSEINVPYFIDIQPYTSITRQGEGGDGLGEFYIYTNDPGVSLSVSHTWFQIDNQSDDGVAHFLVNFDANTGYDKRSGSITVTGTDETKTIIIEQNPPTPVTSVTEPDDLTLEVDGSIKVVSNSYWIARIGEDLHDEITINGSTADYLGTGNKTITITSDYPLKDSSLNRSVLILDGTTEALIETITITGPQ